MKRRQWLQWAAGTLVLAHPMVRAQSHGAHGAAHGGGHGAGHGGQALAAGPVDLLPVTGMRGGAPLAALTPLINQHAGPGRFQATLTAAPVRLTLADGLQTECWAYNGMLPGPQIVVTEGDEVEIVFRNQLPEATTVHWHGLNIPADQDGNPHDSVAPGAQRTYRFRIPDDSAGTYWYHPHPHGRSAMQVARGLAGTLVVRARQDPLAAWPEQHWMLSDVRLDRDGQIPENTQADWFNGREGQFLLINGQHQPRIAVSDGHRIRIWNSCSARYLQLRLPGCQWQLLGTDGGLLSAPRPPVDTLMLAPAERVEVRIVAPEAVATDLISEYYDRAKMFVEPDTRSLTVAQVQVQVGTAPALPATLRRLALPGEPSAHQRVVFSERALSASASQAMLQDAFLINGRRFDPMRVDLRSEVGAVERWEVMNASHMDHPFHLHGAPFMVMQRAQHGHVTPEAYLAWRDTVNIRPEETVTFLVRQDWPGLRMFHCHILEHEDLGMMGTLLVV